MSKWGNLREIVGRTMYGAEHLTLIGFGAGLGLVGAAYLQLFQLSEETAKLAAAVAGPFLATALSIVAVDALERRKKSIEGKLAEEVAGARLEATLLNVRQWLDEKLPSAALLGESFDDEAKTWKPDTREQYDVRLAAVLRDLRRIKKQLRAIDAPTAVSIRAVRSLRDELDEVESSLRAGAFLVPRRDDGNSNVIMALRSARASAALTRAEEALHIVVQHEEDEAPEEIIDVYMDIEKEEAWDFRISANVLAQWRGDVAEQDHSHAKR